MENISWNMKQHSSTTHAYQLSISGETNLKRFQQEESKNPFNNQKVCCCTEIECHYSAEWDVPERLGCSFSVCMWATLRVDECSSESNTHDSDSTGFRCASLSLSASLRFTSSSSSPFDSSSTLINLEFIFGHRLVSYMSYSFIVISVTLVKKMTLTCWWRPTTEF